MKKKLLLKILLPISLLIIALSIFLGCFYGCKPKFITINNKTINQKKSKYKVESGKDIWLNSIGDHITLGHNVLNLKALSMAHKNVTNFFVDGDINFGFLVDFDMDCHLTGSNNELMQWSGNGIGCGVIVGETTQPTSPISYSGHINIEPSMTFDISSTDNFAYGVRLQDTTASSIQKINGTFKVSSSTKDAYGVFINGVCAGNTTINGTFSIYSLAYVDAVGVYFDSAETNSTQTINGTFTISSAQNHAYGVIFVSTALNSIQTINGIFSLTTISIESVIGVYFQTASAGNANIGGTFALYNASSGVTRSIYFSGTGVLVTKQAHFFSNKIDSSCSSLPNGTVYSWNGILITTNGVNQTNPDPTLNTTDIKDDESAPHFLIKVINNAMNSNRTTFNTAYKNALGAFIVTCGDSIAKSWLESIVGKIPL
ncbi:MAG: hypothetical protein LBG49_02275 [Mycoplasmataceae bacterium]|nr:hypothetical protein [Mycoplasmataceae bacterium]